MRELNVMLNFERIRQQAPDHPVNRSTLPARDPGGPPIEPQTANAPRDYRFWPEIAHLPGWMQMINGQEFCLLCQKFASRPHIASDRHRALQTHFEAAPWALQTRAEAAPTADLADQPSS